jgi:hypothetical protein
MEWSDERREGRESEEWSRFPLFYREERIRRHAFNEDWYRVSFWRAGIRRDQKDFRF